MSLIELRDSSQVAEKRKATPTMMLVDAPSLPEIAKPTPRSASATPRTLMEGFKSVALVMIGEVLGSTAHSVNDPAGPPPGAQFPVD